jgi:hypothetical protein
MLPALLPLLKNPLVQQGLITGGGLIANRLLNRKKPPTFDSDKLNDQLRGNVMATEARRLASLQGIMDQRGLEAEGSLAATGMATNPAARANLMSRVYNANNQAVGQVGAQTAQSLTGVSDAMTRTAMMQYQMDLQRYDQDRSSRAQGISDVMSGVSDYLDYKRINPTAAAPKIHPQAATQATTQNLIAAQGRNAFNSLPNRITPYQFPLATPRLPKR